MVRVNDNDKSLVLETLSEVDRVGEWEYELDALGSLVSDGVKVSDGLSLSVSDLSGVLLKETESEPVPVFEKVFEMSYVTVSVVE